MDDLQRQQLTEKVTNDIASMDAMVDGLRAIRDMLADENIETGEIVVAMMMLMSNQGMGDEVARVIEENPFDTSKFDS